MSKKKKASKKSTKKKAGKKAKRHHGLPKGAVIITEAQYKAQKKKKY